MTILCVIPARGGSKGIPRKNLQTVGGIPLIDRAILTVIESGVADNIFVSSDDSEILGRAVALGVSHIERPLELAGDNATSESVLLHAIEYIKSTDDLLLFVQATTPFLQPGDLKNLVAAHDGFDSSLTVTESHGFIWQKTSDGGLEGVNHRADTRLRRQDLSHQEFLENGAAYIANVSGFLKSRHRFFGRIGFSIMPKARSLEIDTPEDLLLANLIHPSFKK